MNVSTEVPVAHPGVVDALRRADGRGVPVVLAAGNDGRDLDAAAGWTAVDGTSPAAATVTARLAST